MLLLNIDPNCETPVYRQIHSGILALVKAGNLKAGDRLPSSRRLAEDLGVHRSTVVRAYEELRALGYLESRPGGYSTVRRRVRLATAEGVAEDEADALLDWMAQPGASLSDHPAMELERSRSAGIIDLDHLSADPTLAPSQSFGRIVRQVLHRCAGDALDYADAAGWGPLREVIASRMTLHGVRITPGEVLVTAGAQEALDLILRYLTVAGDSVVAESPTYGMGHALFRLHGVQPLEIPLLSDGMDLDKLEWVLQQRQPAPKLVYSMPTFHNPTGITTGQVHRERLLMLCEQYRLPLVEDGFEEEMKYFGQAVLPVKSMDSRGVVLYVGTFSKVVFPGLRIGWIVAPAQAIRQLTAIRHASCITGNTLAQAAAARFCSGGDFERYLRRVHGVYRKRMQSLLNGVARHLPAAVTRTHPRGGYTLWLQCPRSMGPEQALVARIRAAGVKVGPGSRYFATPPETPHLRLCIACSSEAEIEEGCRRLGGALRAAMEDGESAQSR